MSKVVIVVQARMTSTRLPSKVLMPILGKPLLAYQIERLGRVRLADAIVVATTTNATDDPIVALCNALNVLTVRGSETDVLGRYVQAAKVCQADVVIRVTSDCPLIDPDILDQLIAFYTAHRDIYDYVSNTLSGHRTYPRGLDAEIFSAALLFEIETLAQLPTEREHVTPYIYEHPEKYNLGVLRQVQDWSRYRWTVDTPEDFELIRRILSHFEVQKPGFNLEDVYRLIQEHPDWSALNAQVEQKTI